MWRDGGGLMLGGGSGGGDGGGGYSDREAGWESSHRTAWGQQQPERDTPPFPSKSHLQPLHHSLPAAMCLMVKTKALVASQTPVRISPTGFTFVSQFPPPSATPSPLSPWVLHPPSARHLLLFQTLFLCQAASALLNSF